MTDVIVFLSIGVIVVILVVFVLAIDRACRKQTIEIVLSIRRMFSHYY